MITIYFIWHALIDTIKIIWWGAKWLVKIAFTATVYVTLFVITVVSVIIGKIIGWVLRKAGVDTDKWSPDWDKLKVRLDSLSRKLDYKLWKLKNPPRRRPSTDITVEEMIIYDIIDGD